jgi:2-polyprenyl-6-methoxyphenol hydroxylase-like FAD-dependent oxidoreductase
MAAALRVLIAGGGIAGLALARALKQRGLESEIVERADDWDRTGTGLFVPANGVRALAALGLDEAIRRRSCVIPGQRVLDHRGRRLCEVDLGELWRDTGPCLAMHRHALHQVLLDGAVGTKIRPGTTVEFVSEGATSVGVRFSDRSSREYDVLVGADGVHSSIRQLVFDGAPPRHVGQVSWRLVLEGAPPVTTWTVMLAPGRAFLLIPIGDRRLYCYADVNAPDARDPTDGVLHRFVDLFRDFGEPVRGVLRRLWDVRPYFSPIEEVTLRSWVHGRVVLIGDAAHATAPNMAQGASMAMEDALVLAEMLATREPVPACLAAFEARREPRVRFVQAQTRRRDRTRDLPSIIRNAVLRLAGGAIFKANNRPLVKAP